MSERIKPNVIVGPKRRLRSDIWNTYKVDSHEGNGVDLHQVKRMRDGSWRRRVVWSRQACGRYAESWAVENEQGKEMYLQSKARWEDGGA